MWTGFVCFRVGGSGGCTRVNMANHGSIKGREYLDLLSNY